MPISYGSGQICEIRLSIARIVRLLRIGIICMGV